MSSAPVDTTAHKPQEGTQGEAKHGNMPLNMVTSYTFYQLDPAFRHLPEADQKAAKEEFVSVVTRFQEIMWVRTYTTFGLREDADFFFWNIAKEVEPIHEFATAMARTKLGRYLKQSHNFVAVSKESEYTRDHQHPPQLIEGEKPYLFIYPFVKTRDWYLLPFPERMRIMKEHIDVGHEFPAITINTAYSFGIDDQDFVVAFDGDSLQEFVRLVMKLRETEASRYTHRDTPMFIGLKKPMAAVLDSLGI